jgi:hypothetical protein
MPSVLDYARAQDPALKDVPDDKLMAYIKATAPDLATSLPAATPRTAFQKQAAANKLGLDVQTHAADMENEIGTAKGKAFGDIAQGAVLGGATLATGGMAAGAAIPYMGLAGLAGGTAKESIKAGFGSTDLPKSPAALARNLGLEAVMGAGGDAAARGIGAGLKYIGSEAIPALAMRSAAKAEAGQQTLVRLQQDSFDQLRTFVRDKGNPTVDIGNDLHNLFQALRQRATGSSQAFKDAIQPVVSKLGSASKGTLGQQPMDALMEIKTDLNHIAYKVKGMNSDEMVALRNLADQVDKKITDQIGTLGGPAAKKVYANYKAFTEQIRTDDAVLAGVSSALQKTFSKSGILGMVPGVDAAMDSVIRSKAAPWVLEHLFSNEQTAGLMKQAMAMAAKGDERAVQRAIEAAINTSGVGRLLTDLVKKNPSPFKLLEEQPANNEAIMPAQTAGP